MKAALPEAEVEHYDHLLPAFQALGSDDHVLAAAVHGGADVIVTNNLKDFPVTVLETYGIAAQDPDSFLIDQWWLEPEIVLSVLREQSAMTRRPHIPLVELVNNSLAHQVPRFASLVSEQLGIPPHDRLK